MTKPEEAPSGFENELPQTAGSSTIILSYYILRLFASLEACPICISSILNVGGVI